MGLDQMKKDYSSPPLEEILSHNWQGGDWGATVFNCLIEKLKLKSYLELGACELQTWNRIALEDKIGVDKNPDYLVDIMAFDSEMQEETIIKVRHADASEVPCLVGTYERDDRLKLTNTDEFFKSLDKDKKFDFIFIDASHDKKQVAKDFLNSFKHLTENGIIALHDIAPARIFNTALTSNGTVFEIWMRLVEHFNEHTFTAGVIGPAPRDAVGFFFNKRSLSCDPSIFNNLNQGFDFFSENRAKFKLPPPEPSGHDRDNFYYKARPDVLVNYLAHM